MSVREDIWTEKRVETLRSMWVAGASSGDIALALRGIVTRNAVMGKINRLGLMGGKGQPSRQVPSRPPVVAARPPVAAPKASSREKAPACVRARAAKAPPAPIAPAGPPVAAANPLQRLLDAALAGRPSPGPKAASAPAAKAPAAKAPAAPRKRRKAAAPAAAAASPAPAIPAIDVRPAAAPVEAIAADPIPFVPVEPEGLDEAALGIEAVAPGPLADMGDAVGPHRVEPEPEAVPSAAEAEPFASYTVGDAPGGEDEGLEASDIDAVERALRLFSWEMPRDDGRPTLLQLKAESCRWPIGDPSKADFHFCGASARLPQPYCAEHCAVAFQVPDRNRPRVVWSPMRLAKARQTTLERLRERGRQRRAAAGG